MGIQETYSVSAIKRLCASSEYLDEEDIREGDKGVSWDGNIVLYKDKKTKAVGREVQIPIQIKGRMVRDLSSKDNIKYPMKTSDLNNYFNSGGIILFVVEIKEGEYNTKPYAKVLLPLDLKQILLGKEKQNEISINLDHLKSHSELDKLCFFFCKNKPKQGQVMLNTTSPDLSDIREFSFSTIRGQFKDPAVVIAKAPHKYMYAKQNGICIPIEAQSIITSREGDIRIQAGKSYNQTHKTQTIYTQEKTTQTIDELLEIVLNDKKNVNTFQVKDSREINFSIAYSFSKLVIALVESDKICFDGMVIVDEAAKRENFFIKLFNTEAQQYFKEILRLGATLCEIGVPFHIFTTEEIFEAQTTINNLKRALIDKKSVILPIKDECGIFYQPLATKKMILEYERLKNGEFVVRDFLLKAKKIHILLDDNGTLVETYNWFAILPTEMNNIIFNREKMLAELSGELSHVEIRNLSNFVMAAISEYDHSKECEWLDFASRLNIVIENAEPNRSESTIINKSQIAFRQGGLSNDEKTALYTLKHKSQDILVKCCVCILLQQVDEFEVLFQGITAPVKNTMKEWPIYNLFLQQKKKLTSNNFQA